jgi:hypothetical protein
MSALDRVRAKFQTPMSGTSKTSKRPSAGSAVASHTHSETRAPPSAGSAGSSDRNSELREAPGTVRARESESRRRKIIAMMQANPALRYSFDVQAAPLKSLPSEAVSVMLGLRDSAGTIVTGELTVPAERWDFAAFVSYWDAQGQPS